MKPEIEFKPVNLEDAKTLFHWENEAENRKMCLNPDPIPWDEHLEWLKQSLANPNRRMLIAYLDHDPIGNVKSDWIHGRAELSWGISKPFRGKGLGKWMVRLLAESIEEPLSAKVKHENEGSKKIASFAGLKESRSDDRCVHFEREKISSPICLKIRPEYEDAFKKAPQSDESPLGH